MLYEVHTIMYKCARILYPPSPSPTPLICSSTPPLQHTTGISAATDGTSTICTSFLFWQFICKGVFIYG